MGKSDHSCGCIISLFVGALVLWGISCSIAIDWDLNPVVVFVTAIILLGLLAYLLMLLVGALDGHLASKKEKKYNEIQNKYPKAFAKYLAENGHTVSSEVPETFKQTVVKRQGIIWENEEIAIAKDEQAALKRKEDEKRAEEDRKLSEIEKFYPNGFRIWREKNLNCSADFVIRNKFYIENEESNYQAEQKRRKQAEEKSNAERHNQLESNAYAVLTLKVVQWELLRPGFHYSWLFYYYPTTCDFEPPYQDKENRRTVWHFKNAPERKILPAIHERAVDIVIPQIKQKLINTFGADYLQFLTLVCLPASTRAKTQARYEEFSEQLCSATGMENGYSHLTIIKDGLSKNDPNNTTGHSIQPEVKLDDWFKGKYVLLFDDIVTKGETMLRYNDLLKRKGATVIGGLALGKTKHERPAESPRYVHFDDDIMEPPF